MPDFKIFDPSDPFNQFDPKPKTNFPNKQAEKFQRPNVVNAAQSVVNDYFPNKHGALDSLRNFVATRGLSKNDETGNIRVGPEGLNIERSNLNQTQPDWSLNINPRQQSASFSKGNFQISGNWNKFNPGVEIGFRSGNTQNLMGNVFNTPQSAVDAALNPYTPKYDERRELTPREELELQLANRRHQDPNWYRP